MNREERERKRPRWRKGKMGERRRDGRERERWETAYFTGHPGRVEPWCMLPGNSS